MLLTSPANMKVIVFYIHLCLLLLCGGNSSYADTHYSFVSNSFTQKFPEKEQVKLLNPIKNSMLTESAYLDLDEEFHSDDDYNDGTGNKIAAVNHNLLLNNWYLTFSTQIITKDYTPNTEIFAPFCGYSNPIYIRQQVLRI